jgi:ATP-dependent RNA helicase DeaD
LQKEVNKTVTKKDFGQLEISERLTEVLRQQGIQEPTDIQLQSIPHIMKGRDLIGQAQTGTGKTLAFLLPILEKLNAGKDALQALILSPTRELAMQIVRELRDLNAPIGDAHSYDVLAVVGGTDIERQIQRLKRQPHIIVATPGRLVDLILRKKILLHTAKTLVIDEADQMIEMGFMEDVERIMRHIRKDRQTLLFSATFPLRIRKLTQEYMRNPLHVHVNQNLQTVPEIELHYMMVSERNRDELFAQMVQLYNPYLGIIFANTREQAGLLGDALKRRGMSVDVLHGELQQSQRKQVLQKFRDAKIQFLVASDLAARGLDIEGVTHVFNYEFPRDISWFIHRIGRTGRAGESGIAVSLFTSKDMFKLSKAEKSLGRRMKQMEIVEGQLVAKSRTLRPLDAGSKKPAKERKGTVRQMVTEEGEAWSTRKPRTGKPEQSGGPAKKTFGKPAGKFDKPVGKSADKPSRPGKPARPGKPGNSSARPGGKFGKPAAKPRTRGSR